MVKKKYWKSFKEHYPLLMGHSIGLILVSVFSILFIVAMLKFLEGIDDSFGKVLGLIVLLGSYIRLLNALGHHDLVNTWANRVYEAFTRSE